MNRKMPFLIAFIVLAGLAAALAQPQPVGNFRGTMLNAFDIGVGATKLTLTNNAGALSVATQIQSSLATGTAPFSIASTTKVTNLNVDAVDGFSLVAGGNGGVFYQSSSTGATATSAGTAGNLVVSGGTGAPTFLTLTSAQMLVGSSGNLPEAVAMSGDATISNAGAVTIANDAVTTVKVLNNAVTAAKLATAVQTEILTGSLSIGAESSNTIECIFQLKDANGSNLARAVPIWIVLSDAVALPIATGQTIDSHTFISGGVWEVITTNKSFEAFTDNSSGTCTIWFVTTTNTSAMTLNVWVANHLYSGTVNFN